MCFLHIFKPIENHQPLKFVPKYILRYSLLFSFMESLEFYWSLKLEGSAWEILVLQKKNSRYLDLPLRLLTFISSGNAKYFSFRTNWVTIVGFGTEWETIISFFFILFHLQNKHCKVEFTGKGWQTIICSSFSPSSSEQRSSVTFWDKVWQTIINSRTKNACFFFFWKRLCLLHFKTKWMCQALSAPELKD